MDIIRTILVDDHSILREGLRMIIDNDPQIEVLGEAVYLWTSSSSEKDISNMLQNQLI